MYSKLVGVFAVGLVAVGVVTTAHAQQNMAPEKSVDIGKYEYDGHCAICHGLSGTAKEEGEFSSLLSKTSAAIHSSMSGLARARRCHFICG